MQMSVSANGNIKHSPFSAPTGPSTNTALYFVHNRGTFAHALNYFSFSFLIQCKRYANRVICYYVGTNNEKESTAITFFKYLWEVDSVCAHACAAIGARGGQSSTLGVIPQSHPLCF